MRATIGSAAFLWALIVLRPVFGACEADSPMPLVYDYPAMQKLAADGLNVPADGTYEVWIWGKGPDVSITIGEQKLQAASKDRFAWLHPGQVKLEKGRRVTIALPTNDDHADITNVPGYLALSTDPNFDPKRQPLGGLRTLYDASGFKPYASKDEWLKRRATLRQQILVSAGLEPMPPKGDLKPQIYGKEIRDGYTIEKVVLETFPGFYLSGSLYRPAPWVPIQDEPNDVKDRKAAWEPNRAAEKKPGILCPHGHWRYGRFEPEVQKRCKQMARMGAVVFSYDMVGYADSKDFGHKFLDPQIDLMGFSLFGLQTWNSIRALDFLTALPDVDTDRVACTGASGGGTQTFVLAAIDDRLKVAAPTVMVSQDMQGGCACENASNFRIGTDNSEIAALFAPKPQIMVCCTGDWTKEFPTKGFPEVKATYALYDAADRVETDIFEFPHNYNQTTRERVYAFLSKHLFHIDPAQSKELPLEAESSETISTWDSAHPRPADAVTADSLKRYLAGVVAEQAQSYRPTTNDKWPARRAELAAALSDRLALGSQPAARPAKKIERSGDGSPTIVRFGTGATPRVRGAMFFPSNGRHRAETVVVHPDGINGLVGSDGKPGALLSLLLGQGHAVLAIDFFGVGENKNPFAAAAPSSISHYSCYNRTPAAERVKDIVDAVNFVHDPASNRPVNLIGLSSAGPLCLIARTQTPHVARTAIDANQFDYRADSDLPSDQVLPGIVRLGGLRAVGCLAAPGRLFIHNTGDGLDTSWIAAAYDLNGARTNFSVDQQAATIEQISAAVTH
jgi:dienelactone hydrolase